MSMSVDLSKAVKGSTVHFRCGGSAVVEEILSCDRRSFSNLSFKDYGRHFPTWYNNGSVYTSGDKNVLDIIRIDPPAFNLDDVKPGMAFDYDNPIYKFEGPAIFLSRHPVDNEVGIFQSLQNEMHIMPIVMDDRIGDRLPEHDIEVK